MWNALQKIYPSSYDNKTKIKRNSSGRKFYRVSIKSFPDYKHLLQENYVEYKHIFYHYLS